jgi:hypothetical protein
MSDPTKRHIDGHRQTLVALDMVARKGFSADETAQRLLCALAGENCLSDLDPKTVRRLTNKLNHSAGTLANMMHGLHCAFLDALRDAKVIAPVPDKAPADLSKPDAEDEIAEFVAEVMNDPDHADLIDRVVHNKSLYEEGEAA